MRQEDLSPRVLPPKGRGSFSHDPLPAFFSFLFFKTVQRFRGARFQEAVSTPLQCLSTFREVTVGRTRDPLPAPAPFLHPPDAVTASGDPGGPGCPPLLRDPSQGWSQRRTALLFEVQRVTRGVVPGSLIGPYVVPQLESL
jgi:hypothetical protein